MQARDTRIQMPNLNYLRTNVFVYHIISAFMGIAFFYLSNYALIFVAPEIGPIFQYIPLSEDNFSIVLVNFFLSLFFALVPAIFTILILHFLLLPKTKLFLVPLTLSLITMCTWSMYSWYAMHNEIVYVYPLIGMTLGKLAIVWLVAIVYFRIKPKQLTVDQA
jgi:hypothetical protein